MSCILIVRMTLSPRTMIEVRLVFYNKYPFVIEEETQCV